MRSKTNITYFILISLFSLRSVATSVQNTKPELVEITKINPRIKIDIIYATARNFTHQVIYSAAKCYLLRDVAIALSRVQEALEKKGYGLLVWDGYRPLPAQWKLWEICPDERYVSNPVKGGRHTRGTAVDVTLVCWPSGESVSMPTEFDDFTERADRSFNDLPVEIIRNRALLQTVMEEHGFKGYEHEWWHFDFVGWEKYIPLSINFDELEKIMQN